MRKLAMEQAYTITLKLMFYHVLRLKYENLSGRLSDISISGDVTPGILKRMLDSLFEQAVVESKDFQIVFEMNLVDSIELPKYSVQKFMSLFNFLREVDWRSLDYDIVGTILEDMIWKERRHLLGQFFTRPEVVDLILGFSLREIGFLLDPCVGSGTFLVRAYQRMRQLDPTLSNSEIISMLYGLDIDKNVAMLAAINLYIRDPLATGISMPRISRIDFFSDKVKQNQRITSLPQKEIKNGEDAFEFEIPLFRTVVANPPYTRQEEMESAFYSARYKSKLVENSIKPVALSNGRKLAESWSAKASIYSYFMVKSADQLLDKNGRLGFITSNSWLDSSFGNPMKEYFLDRFKIIAILDSCQERWFEDADINTVILIIEKLENKDTKTPKNHYVKFVSLRAPLSNLIGRSPSGFDITEMRNYWADLENFVSEIETAHLGKNKFEYFMKTLHFAIDDQRMRVITVSQSQLKADEKWGIFLRAPSIWFKILDKKKKWFSGINESGLYKIRRGFTTNANELYYLPSKHWKVSRIDENNCHILQSGRELILPTSFVKPVVKSPTELKKHSVEKKNLKRHLIYLQQEKKDIENGAVLEYIAWMERLVASECFTSGRFPSLAKKLFAPELNLRTASLSKIEKKLREAKELKDIAKDFLDGKSVQTSADWYKLPVRKAAQFLCVPGINERFAFYINNDEALEDKRLYGMQLIPTKIPQDVFFGILNSTITYLATELWGRTELGQGALDLAVEDYEAMPIIDARRFWKSTKAKADLKQRLSTTVLELTRETVLPIEKELGKKCHKELDKLILEDVLGLSQQEIEELQKEMVALVKRRLSRAQTVQLSRRSKIRK
jgi:type I restriction-modification system DNA methylase subunit